MVNGTPIPGYYTGNAVNMDSIAAGAYSEITLTFPVGYFSVVPSLILNPNRPQATISAASITTTSATIRAYNLTGSNVGATHAS